MMPEFAGEAINKMLKAAEFTRLSLEKYRTGFYFPGY